MQREEIARLESGVDWITFITRGRNDSDEVDEIAEEIKQRDLEQGSALKPFYFQGYRGWRTASCSRGYTQEGSLLLSSSSAADDILTRLVSCTGQMTRLDVQVTCELSRSRLGLERLATTRSTKSRQSPTRYPTRRGHSSWNDGSAIGMVGRRTKPRYIRCYDKGVESGTAAPGVKWRWEVEAKQGLADNLWRDYQTATDHRTWCYRSCESQWKRAGCSWHLPASSKLREAVGAGTKKEPQAHSLAAWLRTTVAPTLPRVLAVYDVAQLLEILGLAELATPREVTDGVR